MTNEKLLELLREARESVEGYRSAMEDCPDPLHREENCTCMIVRKQKYLLGLIDAALKEHETPVEWVCPRLGSTHFASVGNASVSVSKQIGNDYWWWTINHIVLGPTEGWAMTEEDAKAAAIAAARSVP